MTDGDEDEPPVAFNLSPEQMTALLAEAASKERTVIEFRTNETDDGGRQLDTAIEITDHVAALEDEVAAPTHDHPLHD